jgi:hypothetical protein
MKTYYIYDVYCWILPRMKNVSDRICRENENTHFMFNNLFAKTVPLWDNVEKCGTAPGHRWQIIKCRKDVICVLDT